MSRPAQPVRWILPIAAAVLACGCGRPAGIVFEPLETPLFWPPPPETAQIHYVGVIESDADLKPAVTLGQILFGRDPIRTMLSPYAIATDDQSRLFVCDSNAQVVHVFNLEDRSYEQWRPPEWAPAFAQPVGIAYGGAGPWLVVSDALAGTIFVFDGAGAYQGQVGAAEAARPCGVAFDTAGRLYAADAGTHEVLVFSADGVLERRVGGRGTGPGEFNYPTNVAIDLGGRLYVSDTLNARVQVFDAALRFERQIGSKGDLPGYFSQPKGLALDSDDHLYVVDAHFECVQVFTPDGQLLLSVGNEGRGPGEFWLPAGIHIDADDRIWIADTYNRRVQVLDYRPEVVP
ncbi:MAG: 6-bladed beta-propeller [Phycisphaerales bacterium]